MPELNEEGFFDIFFEYLMRRAQSLGTLKNWNKYFQRIIFFKIKIFHFYIPDWIHRQNVQAKLYSTDKYFKRYGKVNENNNS